MLDHLKALVADNCADNRLLIVHYLNLNGIKADSATDGEEAITMALTRKYDLILMDVEMPKVNGLKAVAELRSQGFSKPIVAITDHALKQTIDECARVGFTSCLIRPFDLKALKDVILRTTSLAAEQTLH